MISFDTNLLFPALDPGTRVVAITWVHSSTGVKIPVRALAQAVSDVNRSRGESERIFVVGLNSFQRWRAKPA